MINETALTVGTLCSGSSGNCTLIRAGGTAILVDAGRSAKYLRDSLAVFGIAPEEIAGIFVTHPHSDHISALRVFTGKYGTPVHAAGATAFEITDLCAPGVIREHPAEFSLTLGGLEIHSFPTSHDTSCSVGYRVTVTDGRYAGVAFGVCTDLGIVTEPVAHGLSGVRAAVIECNHDVEMLLGGPYTPDMKQRILSRRGHLSNPDAAALAIHLARNGADALLLAHLSEINNTPDLALGTVSGALSGAGLSPYLYVGAKDRPVMMVNV